MRVAIREWLHTIRAWLKVLRDRFDQVMKSPLWIPIAVATMAVATFLRRWDIVVPGVVVVALALLWVAQNRRRPSNSR